MKYVAALPVILLFAVLDVVCIVGSFGFFLLLDRELHSYRFACGVFEVRP